MKKTGLITGATGGLGFELVKYFYANGYSLVITDINLNKLKKVKKEIQNLRINNKQTIDIYKLDFNRIEKIKFDKLKIFVLKNIGTPAVIINCAGFIGKIGKAWETEAKDYVNAFNCNLFSVIEICSRFVPLMIKKKYGKIINVAGGGATSPRENFTPYALAKTSIVRYTENLARELELLQGNLNLNVNCISPGIMKSGMTKHILEFGKRNVGKNEIDKLKKEFSKETDSKKLAAELCLFLASKESDGVSGKLISAVWDNWKDLPKRKKDIADSDVYTLRRIIPSDRGFKWS